MTASAQTHRPGAVGTSRAVATLCVVQFVDVLGVTSAITAIPAILRGLSAPPQVTGVLATIYATFFGGLLVLGSRLGDRYGHRRVLLAGIGLFTLVALIGATAQEIVQLLAAVALQGVAAAVSVPCALRLLLHVSPEPAVRRTAVALWSASGAMAGVLGYLVGGVLTQALGWRSIYWINAPIGVLLIVGVIVFVTPLAPQDRQQRLDIPGAVLLISAVMAVIVGSSLVERPELRMTGVVLASGGLLLGAGFAVQQRHSPTPLIPRAAFAFPNLRTGTLVSLVNTATTSSAGVLATLLLQQQLGATPMEAGLTLMPFSLGVIVGSLLTRPLAGRVPVNRLGGFGLGGIAAGNLILAVTYGTVAGIIVGVVVAGTGLGMASVAATSIGTNVPDSLSSSATGLLNTGAQLGTALGVAALVTLSTNVTTTTPGPAVAWAAAAVAAGTTGAAMWLRGTRTTHDVRASDSPALTGKPPVELQHGRRDRQLGRSLLPEMSRTVARLLRTC